MSEVTARGEQLPVTAARRTARAPVTEGPPAAGLDPE